MQNRLKIALAAGAAGLMGLTGAASAQETSLEQVLRDARAAQAEAQRENQAREQRFLQERNQQQARVQQVRNQVAAATARSNELDAQFEANEAEIAELDQELDTLSGEFDDLVVGAKSAANEFANVLKNSVTSAQYRGRIEEMEDLGSLERLPAEEELRNLYLTMTQEIVAQSQVTAFPTTVVLADGTRTESEMTRIGPFVAFNEGDYYVMDSENRSGRIMLEELARQPSGAAQDAARRVEGYDGDGFVAGVIDPSQGALLDTYVEVPNLKERFDQGRAVGKVIAVLAAIGVIIGLYKWVTLLMTNAAVRGQMRKKTPSKSNPLGRIMMAYQSNPNADTETMALKIDDAVMREVPKLESGLNLIKVLAAVAPLLGLLGTVIGMINTFQAITLFGTGDPQRMASGISEALITTVLGLMAAIPLLLLHAFASGAARSVTNVLEEQSAGMIAEHAEARG